MVAIALYFLDFYTCPQLNHGSYSTKVEIETDLDDMQDDIDDSQADKRTTMQKLKNFGNKFTSRRTRDSTTLDRPMSSAENAAWLKSHGLTAETAASFFRPDNYAAYVKGVKDAKPPKFAIGGKTGVSNLATALARSYFAMACTCIDLQTRPPDLYASCCCLHTLDPVLTPPPCYSTIHQCC